MESRCHGWVSTLGRRATGTPPNLWSLKPPLSLWAVVGGYLALGFIAWA